MKKAKTSLLSSLQKAFQISLLDTNVANEIFSKSESNGLSRRSFLLDASALGVAVGVSGFSSRLPDNTSVEKDSDHVLADSETNAPEKSQPRVVIIGAGIAGLHAAYILHKSGIKAQIYEADNRVGGRIRTVHKFGDQLATELGGEFIDTNHLDMLRLAKEFKIPVVDTNNDKLVKEIFFINNKQYKLIDVVNEFRKVSKQIKKEKDLLEANDYQGDRVAKLDRTTLKAYLAALPISSWFRQLLDAAYVAELGLETDKQSAINFIDLIGVDTQGMKFDIFGESDERFKLRGGNEQLIAKLSERISGQITLNQRFTSLRKNKARRTYTLSFGDGKKVEADYVILTLPFTILRNCDLSGVSLPTLKKQCIQELGYGTNAKLILGFKSKIWREAGYQGYMFNEQIHNGWECTHLQGGSDCAYTVFVGGDAGVALSRNYKNPKEAIDKYLPIIETAFRNTNGFNGKWVIANWPDQLYAQCSYSCYLPGQWTTISGQEIEPVGHIYFAGEHCSSDFQGYMNGGAETGRVAAESILQKIKVAAR